MFIGLLILNKKVTATETFVKKILISEYSLKTLKDYFLNLTKENEAHY